MTQATVEMIIQHVPKDEVLAAPKKEILARCALVGYSSNRVTRALNIAIKQGFVSWRMGEGSLWSQRFYYQTGAGKLRQPDPGERIERWLTATD